jgi:hypothetical protein
MVSIVYKKYGIRINSVWFCDTVEETLKNNRADIVFFHGADGAAWRHGIVLGQLTMLTDLTEPEDVISGRMSQSCRNRISKAVRAGMEFVLYDSAALRADPSLIGDFLNDYDEFTKLKGIPNSYNTAAMEEYLEGGNIILSKAFKGGDVYASSIILHDGRHTRGLYSVSRFRSEGVDMNLAGNANRFLHWNEIKYFHEHGYETFDWGGLTSITDPNGVDSFKLSFGGDPHTYSNIMEGRSLLGKLAIFLMKLFRLPLFRT